MSGEIINAATICRVLAGALQVAYEAGPARRGLARELAKPDVECVLPAPSKIPRAPGDREGVLK